METLIKVCKLQLLNNVYIKNELHMSSQSKDMPLVIHVQKTSLMPCCTVEFRMMERSLSALENSHCQTGYLDLVE